MSLTAGSRIGIYEVVSPLGSGGMGEVYRARDPQLKREVALKILPADVAGDAERLARFQREAEILASLNHPHIAHLYGLAEAEGIRALVMELVEGETLAEVLARGPVAVAEALAWARQIAEALEAAHDRGVVHRDLKPANIKVTPDANVKVLDFGLARPLDPPDRPGVSLSPTITSPALTKAGVILGTAAYMSPEQARGRPVDARTDVWSFGCVVFELLSGRRVFIGDTVTDILGAIVHKEPAWSLLPVETPDRLRRLLARCLTKELKQRQHSIADVRMEIEELLASRRPGAEDVQPVVAYAGARIADRGRGAWALAGSVLTALAAAAVMWSGAWPGGGAAEPPALRLSILHTEGTETGVAVISPDGRRVAYPARRADGVPMVWVRDLDQSTPRPLAGTDEGERLFWSPDSKRVGFVAGTVLKHVSADGGPVQEVTRRVYSGASWAAGDLIVHAMSDGLYRTSAAGGQSAAVTKVQGPDWQHVWPSMLPDGRHFLFTARHYTGLAEAGAQGIYLGSLDDGLSDFRQLMPDLSSAVYAAPGYIVFARDGQLMAVPFELDTLQIAGEPVALGEVVATEGELYAAALSAAANGVLAIRPPPLAGQMGAFEAELTLLNRDGSVASRFGGVQKFAPGMALSPDGRSVAAVIQDLRTSAPELWRIEVGSGARTPVSSMRSAGGWVGGPLWSPDGLRLAFGCQPPGTVDDVCVRDFRSGSLTTLIASTTIWEHPSGWSPDSEHMLVGYNELTESSTQDLHVWSAKTGTLTPYIKNASGIFSPDVRFVAFSSTETGRSEVSVTTFPERRQTWHLTTEGGRLISWSADGREILVATRSGHIEAYPIDTRDGNFLAGPPTVLIRNLGFEASNAQATRDHSRILVRAPKDAEKDKGEIRLLFGWTKALK